MDDIVAEVVPVIAGGVYERERPNGEVEQMVCLATLQQADVNWGLFRRYGFSDERIQEGAEDMCGWILVWAPGVKISDRTGKPVRKYGKKNTAEV